MVEPSFSPRPARGPLAVITVFALGVVFGAALTVVLMRVVAGPHPFGRPGFDGGGHLARMARDLDLDAQQEQQFRRILERSHRGVREILDHTHEEIRALLRPDQREKFDRLRPLSPPPPGEPPPKPGP
jgi:Spy/CpxP family protein refolding chaperone